MSVCRNSKISTRQPRKSEAQRRRAALDRLRQDPAVQTADPAAREWLLALLEHRDEKLVAKK
jgi:hypothetical protein